MPEAEIRKALKSDLKDVEYICRMTAGPLSRENELVGKIIAKTYSTYYIEEECGNCFVLASGEKAVGYILSSLDAGVFKKVYRKKYVPQIFSLSKKDGVLAWLLPIPYMFFKKNYPAHMHIDILPGFQGLTGTRPCRRLPLSRALVSRRTGIASCGRSVCAKVRFGTKHPVIEKTKSSHQRVICSKCREVRGDIIHIVDHSPLRGRLPLRRIQSSWYPDDRKGC